MMQRLIYILLIIFMLHTSCRFEREVKKNSETNVSQSSLASQDIKQMDSTSENTTINYNHADSSNIKLLLACDSLNQVYIKELISYKSGKNISIPDVAIKDNILTSNCKIDSFAVYLIFKQRYTVKENTDKSEASYAFTSNTIASKVTNTKIPYIVILATIAGIIVLIFIIKKYILWKG